MLHKNRDRCPDYLPDDLTNRPGPAEISSGTTRIVLPAVTRREQRRSARQDRRELAGPALVPRDPTDDELRADLEGGTLADDLRLRYRLRNWWTAGGIVDRLRAFCWLLSMSERLDVGYAPGRAPAR